MTKKNLVTGPRHHAGAGQGNPAEHKVEKLLLVNGNGELAGLNHDEGYRPRPAVSEGRRDSRGRLRVGAAVSVHEYERIEALIAAGRRPNLRSIPHHGALAERTSIPSRGSRPATRST